MSYTTEQLERETEQTRHEMAATLDELRTRITPGQMVDQVVDYARDSGGGELLHNLKRQVIANPLPLTLVGAGIAWLMMSNGRPTADGAARRGVSDIAEGMSRAADGGGGTASDAGNTLAGAAG